MSGKGKSSNSNESMRGVALLHDPLLNKGTAFTEEERDALGLRGLLPPRVQLQDIQVMRVLDNLRHKHTDLDRYIYLISLQDRNETLFYRVLIDHLEELMPIVYTPTVGKACQEFGHIYRQPRGLYISANDRGNVAGVLRNWPHKDVRIIVITDGERILGLGDLGAHGMGIPIGKLSLYTACAGIRPDQCLPITLDVGTNVEEIRKDPIYIGLPQTRLRGKEYEDLIEEFVTSAVEIFPRALIQFEDFATTNAFRLVKTYADRICTFDDDIQGTGSVALAGIYSALRITGGDLAKERFVLLGAGEAGIGIANLIMAAMVDKGLSEEEARGRCWLMDSKGLVVKSRTDLAEHKLAFAHDHAPAEDLESVVRALRPAGLIGVSGQPGTFTRSVVEAMGEVAERPIIFALSNPTSKAECTARQAYEWTGGRAIFASGSPFGPVNFEDRTFVPGQGNNAYIFPGVGLGAIVCESTTVTNEMFFVAARVLADQVSDADLDLGRVYPALSRIREVSAKIATAVAEVAYERGFARVPRPDDLEAFVREQMYEPDYQS